MSRATSPSSTQPYGLPRVCREWELSRSTVYPRRESLQSRAAGIVPRRRRPTGHCHDQTLVAPIRNILMRSSSHFEGYRKVWARLQVVGLRTSKRQVQRLIREPQLTTVRRSLPIDAKRHGVTIVTERPDQMWGTDLTLSITMAEGHASVFASVCHRTWECFGIHASKAGTRFEALEQIRRAVRKYFASHMAQVAICLALRHDHSSVYFSNHFHNTLKFFGIESSPAFVRELESRGSKGPFFRTLKKQLLRVCDFETISELRLALHEFRRLYTENWTFGRHGYLTPSQVRSAHATRQDRAE